MQHNISPSLQSFGLPETPVLIGQSHEYLHPSQEKTDFKNHPAGLQMAPCGCFFDPRIYRIEWAPDDFPQSPVFKVMGGPGMPQNANVPDSQRFMKTPGQPVSYSSFQTAPGNSQHVLSTFSQESPPLLTEQIHFAPASLHDAQGVKILNLQKQGVMLTKEIKVPQLVITIPGLKHDGHILSTNVYNNLERLHQDPIHQANLDLNHQSQELQKDECYQDKRRVPTHNDTTSKIVLNTQAPTVCNRSLSSPPSGPQDNREQNDPLKDNNIQLEICQTLDVQTSLGLPEEVLLEDAMKMFDCIPGGRDMGSFRNHSTIIPQFKGGKDDQGLEMSRSMMGNSLPYKAPLCDINSLNLPGELLSPDYSSPDISETVAGVDYFYDFLESNEDLNWEERMTGQPSTSTLGHEFVSQQLSGKQMLGTISVKTGQLPLNNLKKRSTPGNSQTCIREQLEI
uniref:Proline-rich protein 22 isoform X1 n=2 Tax=Geotrypetes seraphini TaxID=260995 RepID=A0A6P8S0R7_GEOSA|nr:proline-rich protein 22 isoform X1 [Geotrypetes seraphini]